MVPRETPKIVVSSCSRLPSSKSSRTRALLIARALLVPWATNFSKTSRSAEVNRTFWCFAGIRHSSFRRRVYRRLLHRPKTFVKYHLVAGETCSVCFNVTMSSSLTWLKEKSILTFPSYEFLLYACAGPRNTPCKSWSCQSLDIDKAPGVLQTHKQCRPRETSLPAHPRGG